jgi:hypothetical protein
MPVTAREDGPPAPTAHVPLTSTRMTSNDYPRPSGKHPDLDQLLEARWRDPGQGPERGADLAVEVLVAPGELTSTIECLQPTDLAAIRRWLAEHTPDVDAVRTWAGRVLERLESANTVPELGSPEWAALADTDVRKLAGAIRPALAYLIEQTPAAIADRLRAELDERATAWRRSLAELHADLSTGWHDLGYGIGPSHAEIVRRRNTFPCGQCRRPLRLGITSCGCGWREPTPTELRARARASWARYARPSTKALFDQQGAA